MLSPLQQAAASLAQQNYDSAIALCEQAIATDSADTTVYWYLGLALLLQGQTLEAQATWLSGMSEMPAEQIEANTTELLDLLNTEVLRQTAAEHWQQVWTIRQQISQLAPHDCNK